jgi:hypothetical protein
MNKRSSRRKRLEEYERRIKQAIEVLISISRDPLTPRNIRKATKEAIDTLQTRNFSPAIRAANAISILDELSQDPNMPVSTRVKLWRAISFIEGIRD